MAILVVGSIGLDNIKTPFGEVKNLLGGSAVHFSVAASIVGEVRLVGVVGKDFNESYIKYLEKRHIDLEGLEIKEGKTFHWEGYYEYDMNHAHTVKTELNVFQHFKPKIPERYKNSEYVFLANIDPFLQLEVLRQIKSPKLIVADTMNYWIESKREMLLEVIKKIDIMLLNDSEARELMRTPNLVKAAKKIMSLGPKTVIIKKGEHGAIMFNSNNSIFIAPAFPLEDLIDPTGAGDSFAGGMISFLSKQDVINEMNLRKAVVFGTVIASFTVQNFGTKALDNITYNDIKLRYRQLSKFTSFSDL